MINFVEGNHPFLIFFYDENDNRNRLKNQDLTF